MKKDVLNAGYIELVEHMGGDHSVIRNARRCWRSEDRSNEKSDANLIKHLIKKEHRTPFESIVFTFDIKAPIFVARQWMRHRMGSFQEESLRYCVAEREAYNPFVNNKGIVQDEEYISWGMWEEVIYGQFNYYEYLVESGMPKEQARSILPLGIYTKFYWTVNGSSLMNFLKLRCDKSAQKEIRVYADVILEIVKEVAPVTFNTFEEVVLKR